MVEANFVSALILLGSGLGFAFSLALKSDKGGVLSAALLLFGVMTIWLPPVRDALVHYPVATISVLILLALIFKFTQTLGTVGFLTGGVLALYVITVIVDSTTRQTSITQETAREPPPQPDRTSMQTPAPPTPAPRATLAQPAASPSPTPLVPQPPPPPPEPRTLLASDGAILKFVSGIPYHLKVRNGRATSLRATQGTMRLSSGEKNSSACVDFMGFPFQSGPSPWHEIDRTLRACDGDAIVTVQTSP